MITDLTLPKPEEVEQTKNISRELSKFDLHKQAIKIVFRQNDKEVEMVFPLKAFRLLMAIMEQMALGKSVTLMPVGAQLTTQEAADLLNVSRPFIVKLLKEGKIPFVKVGAHRRIALKDLVEFKKQMVAESEEARDALAQLGQQLDIDE